MRALGLAVLTGLAAVASVAGQSSPATTPVARAFQSFWSANDKSAAADRIPAILKTGVSFDEAVDALRQGREYSANVGAGCSTGARPSTTTSSMSCPSHTIQRCPTR